MKFKEAAPGTNLNIYAIKDELTGTFLQPVFVRTEAEITRWFKMVFNDNKLWKDNPSQFNLYHLGMFNDGTGEFKPTKVEMIVAGTSIPKKE